MNKADSILQFNYDKYFTYKYLFLTFLIGCFQISLAQDIHFSQMGSSPLNLSPAETGDFNADHRFIANYRNQWASVTVPYKTFSASYDNKQKHFIKNIGNIGLGVLFNSDVAGDGNMGVIQAKLSGAFHYKPILDSTLFMSFGANIGYNQYTLDYNLLTFDNQYNGLQHDPNMSTNENFTNTNFHFIDVSLGFKFSYLIQKTTPIHLGIVFNHLGRPKQSFNETKSNALEGKFNTYLSSDIPLSLEWLLRPMLFYYHQGKYNELYYGIILEKRLDHINFRNINFGVFNRTSDALVFRLGLNYESFNFGFSYDINYSRLRVASKGIGAFEFSIIYLLHNSVRYEYHYNKQCPVFL